MARKKRLGEILVDACLITPEQLTEALHLQRTQPRLLGQILVDMGWVGELEVSRAVAELLSIKYIDVENASNVGSNFDVFDVLAGHFFIGDCGQMAVQEPYLR